MDEINVHSSRNANPSTFKDAEESYCLSWCPSRYQFPMIVVGCGKENSAKVSNYLLNHLRVYRKHVYNFFLFLFKIFRCDQNSKWRSCEILDGHQDLVHDVDWAPNMGRYRINCKAI